MLCEIQISLENCISILTKSNILDSFNDNIELKIETNNPRKGIQSTRSLRKDKKFFVTSQTSRAK